MRVRSIFMFIFLGVLILITYQSVSYAVTFPIEYEGQINVKASHGSGTCEKTDTIYVKLLEGVGGGLTGKVGFSIYNTAGGCEIDDTVTMAISGTHDKIGAFAFSFEPGLNGVKLNITGTFNESQITGSGSGSSIYGPAYAEVSFTATPIGVDKTPKITLEPATYPEFQMNILKGNGFTVKIRKEDGIWDSNGKSKLNFSTLIFATDGMDNSVNFINTGANQNIFSVSSDQKEVLLKVTPDPKKFMSYQNVFNIPKNGEHKIGFQICDTDGRCGKSEYTVYFGPLFTAKSVTDLRCTLDRKEFLSIEDIALGNIGYGSPSTEIYFALINAKDPDEYWCAAFVENSIGEGSYIWFEGKVVPILQKRPMSEAYLIELKTDDSIHLSYSLLSGSNAYQPFPAGEYYFFAFAVDLSSGAAKGVFKNVTTCSFP